MWDNVIPLVFGFEYRDYNNLIRENYEKMNKKILELDTLIIGFSSEIKTTIWSTTHFHYSNILCGGAFSKENMTSLLVKVLVFSHEI